METKQVIEDLKSINDALLHEISTHKNYIVSCNNQIKENNRKLWKKCKHKWRYQRASSLYDSAEGICTICGLWEDSSYNNT